MTTPTAADAAATPTLHLARWTVTSGSNANSRGAVVIASGDHQWEASAEGNGAVDALFRAVDNALADVLTGHPRLLALRRPCARRGPRRGGPRDGRDRAAGGRRAGRAATAATSARRTSTNIIAASIEAYIEALNALLAEEHWAGATEAAGNRRRAKVSAPDAKARRAELDEDAGKIDTTDWFNQ